MTAAALWSKVCLLAGINQLLDITQDTSMPFGGYTIEGSIIKHNGDTDTPADVFAVARLAVELFGATMPRPDTINLTPGEWRNITASYAPTLQPNSIDNRVPKAIKPWIHWHHMPTITRTEDDNRSGFLRLAIDCPDIAPSGEVKYNTKVDILHPSFPECVYERWLDDEGPYVVNLFELDGGGWWWLPKYKKTRRVLNPFEQKLFDLSLGTGEIKFKPVGTIGRADDGKRYPFTKAGSDEINDLPINWDDQERMKLNMTDLYITAYKNVERYFAERGAFPRFKVLAYSTYRLPPSSQWIDLSKFDVYYVSRETATWTYADMWADVDVLKGWKATGARIILRPNTLLKESPADPAIFAHFILEVKPDGFAQSTKYSADKDINIYTMMRALQGVPVEQAVREFNGT